MEFKFKARASIELKIKSDPNSKKTKKSKNAEKSKLVRFFQWIGIAIATVLLEKLVTWIIELILNGSFYYFDRRLFYFVRRKYDYYS